MLKQTTWLESIKREKTKEQSERKMKLLDEAIIRLLNEQSTFDYLKETNTELKKAAFENYHWVFIKKWLIGMGFVGIGVLITLLITLLGATFVSPAEPTLISSLAQSIISPSITINGLLITFTPVIAFFFLNELKEMEKESQIQTENIKKIIENDEDEKALPEYQKRVKYERAFFHNLRSGLIKYVGTYLTISLGCLLLLFFAYTLFESPYFLLTDVIVLVSLVVGVSPIVSVALNKTPLTLVTLFFGDKEYEVVTSDA